MKSLKSNKSTKSTLPTCFIVDDSILPKTGKTIENIGFVHDHTTNTFKLGYKYLTLGVYDGKSFLPVDFTLQGEAGKKRTYGLNKKEFQARYTKERCKKTPGYKSEKEFYIDKLTNTITMLENAITNGITAEYLLVDSWFFCDKLINATKLLKLKLIGQWKKNNQNIIL